MKHFSKKLSHVTSLIAVITVVVYGCVSPRLATKYPVINCGQGTICHKEVQKALDDARTKNGVVGMSMSISLPAKNGGFQKTLNFYSGKTTKKGNIAVGPGHDLLGQGSITKSFIVALILQLATEKRLGVKGNEGLDATIWQWFPQYPDWKEVTIRQLLNMTSGIYNYTESKKFQSMILKDPERQWKWFELVNLAYQHKPNNTYFSPGPGPKHWHYSNTGYILAGKIIEKVTHSNLQIVLNERFLGPNSKLESPTLGKLNHTHYIPEPYSADIMKQMIHEYTSKGVDETKKNMSWIGAAGANISNTEDIITWTRLLYQTNLVLSPDHKKQLKSLICMDPGSKQFGKNISQVDTKKCAAGYGLGIEVGAKKNGLYYWYYVGDIGSASSSYELCRNTNINIAINQSTGGDVPAQQAVYSKVYPILLKYKSTKPKL